MRRRDISTWTQGSSSTGQSLRRVAILYSSFQSWFSVSTSLMNTFFSSSFFFACCIHMQCKIVLPHWDVLVCECRDLIHCRMKWASSCPSSLCSYKRLLQGLWSSNKNSSCILVRHGPVNRTDTARPSARNTQIRTHQQARPSYCSMFKLSHNLPLIPAVILL